MGSSELELCVAEVVRSNSGIVSWHCLLALSPAEAQQAGAERGKARALSLDKYQADHAWCIEAGLPNVRQDPEPAFSLTTGGGKEVEYPALTSFLEGEGCKTTYCSPLQLFRGSCWMLCSCVYWLLTI